MTVAVMTVDAGTMMVIGIVVMMVMVMVVMVVMLIVGPIDDQNYGNDGYYNHMVIYNLHQ